MRSTGTHKAFIKNWHASNFQFGVTKEIEPGKSLAFSWQAATLQSRSKSLKKLGGSSKYSFQTPFRKERSSSFICRCIVLLKRSTSGY